MEDAFNVLVENEGYGEVSLVVIKGKLTSWKFTKSNKII